MDGVKNEKLMGYFAALSAIPRGSGNEKAVADFIENFGKERGLFTLRDSFNNVFIRKEASEGRGGKPVMLQAHTDMVCEKTPESAHDFLTEGLTLCFKNGYVCADGTTLGADNGAGCAIMLALLDRDDFERPGIECLFTSGEETGMDGASGFDFSVARSETVINLDGGGDGNACVGCAGGVREAVTIPTERVAFEGVPYKISVSGLCGGHSGEEIDRGRASAFKLLSDVLSIFCDDYPLHLVSLSGGGRDNVIPFAAECVVSFFGKAEAKAAKEKLPEIKKKISDYLCAEDKKHFSLKMEKCEIPEFMLTLKSTSAIISYISLTPQGVSLKVPGTDTVEASLNMGTVSTDERGFHAGYLIRSSELYNSETLVRKVERLARSFGGEAKTTSSHPGWTYRKESPLQKQFDEACKKILGRTATLSVTHGGLECGIFADKIEKNGGMADIISIGPDLYDIHTPKEKMDIASFERTFDVVRSVLENI